LKSKYEKADKSCNSGFSASLGPEREITAMKSAHNTFNGVSLDMKYKQEYTQ
jgi:hypothetical protein